MVTAWSPRRTARDRAGAEPRGATGPLLRLLALAALLFAVALAHGASPDNAGAHLATSAVSVTGQAVDAPAAAAEAAALAADDGCHGEHGSVHPDEQCASGQPAQGPALTAPGLAASVGQQGASGRPPASRATGTYAYALAPSVALKSSVVQQV
ncbi:hypothetical protein [Streptomyces sp. MNP-20]|uniref:hypothetical protein n=1 Tax=Streptomyces sp. MNP-20 TaxID=2721165 RepID=UPI0015554B10|nr:hypothetical protein [Streptomyces sp. MNP-20]